MEALVAGACQRKQVSFCAAFPIDELEPALRRCSTPEVSETSVAAGKAGATESTHVSYFSDTNESPLFGFIGMTSWFAPES